MKRPHARSLTLVLSALVMLAASCTSTPTLVPTENASESTPATTDVAAAPVPATADEAPAVPTPVAAVPTPAAAAPAADPADLTALPDWYDCSSTGTLVAGVRWDDFAGDLGLPAASIQVPGHHTSLAAAESGDVPGNIDRYGTEGVDWSKFRVNLECTFSTGEEVFDSGNEPNRANFIWAESAPDTCAENVQDYIDFGSPGIELDTVTGRGGFRQDPGTYAVRGCLPNGNRIQLILDHGETVDIDTAVAGMGRLLDAYLTALS